MAHNLVKLLVDNDGNPVQDQNWHYVANWGDANRTLCTGEVFEYAEGCATGLVKVVQKGVPCPQCRAIIQQLKKVKL